MEIIYKPKGRANEYAKLAANLYKGCTHGCRYCFGPSALFKKKEYYFKTADPKKEILSKLEKDCQNLNGNCPEILLSFIGDVYQHAEMELGLTRAAIKILISHNLPFTILTKGGRRAVRDFDLLEAYGKAQFGTTLVFWNQADADRWEPDAAPIHDRIAVIKEANWRGIPTWISLEPVIYPDQALKLIQNLHQIVGHWKVGKVNYVKTDVDWIKFREEVTDLLQSVNADYYLKNSLTGL